MEIGHEWVSWPFKLSNKAPLVLSMLGPANFPRSTTRFLAGPTRSHIVPESNGTSVAPRSWYGTGEMQQPRALTDGSTWHQPLGRSSTSRLYVASRPAPCHKAPYCHLEVGLAETDLV